MSASKRDLDPVIAVFLKVGGDLVASSRTAGDAEVFHMRLSHSEDFKKALKSYVKAHNRAKKTSISVSFPKPFMLQFRSSRRTSK